MRGRAEEGTRRHHLKPCYLLCPSSLSQRNSQQLTAVVIVCGFVTDFRAFSTLEDSTKMDGNCGKAVAGFGHNEMYPCINDQTD